MYVSAVSQRRWRAGAWRRYLNQFLNRGQGPTTQIELRIAWPLLLLPIVLLNQLLAPHPVWVSLAVTLLGLYGMGYLWVRSQAPGVALERHRLSTILVAGDTLQEEFELRNDSRLPVLWAEFLDESDLPGYEAGRILAAGAGGFYRWRMAVECRKRGVFRLGPHRLHLQDPFGLYKVQIDFPYSDMVLIYPRVVQLPRLQLPHGNAQGTDRRRRPLRGTQPAATVSEYRAGDSLRHVHWRSSAHRGRLMVKDLEIEPSGDLWIVLDMNAAAHSGDGETSTLEYAVVVAASVAAELLAAPDRRAVGLLAVGGFAGGDLRPVVVVPQPGQAQLWQILAALAPIQASPVALDEMLASNRPALGRRGSLIVVTPQLDPGMAHGDAPQSRDASAPRNWAAELLHLKASGLDSSVVLVAPAPAEEEAPTSAAAAAIESTRELLARAEIDATLVVAGTPLQSLLTFRRRRKVVRTTPTGGVVTYEVEEEVG